MCGNSDFAFVDAETVGNRRDQLNVHKSMMGPDGIYAVETLDFTLGAE